MTPRVDSLLEGPRGRRLCLELAIQLDPEVRTLAFWLGYEFLKTVRPSPPRETNVESIALFTANQATVVCTVTTLRETETVKFHNLRLIVRNSADDTWKLLAWANESQNH